MNASLGKQDPDRGETFDGTGMGWTVRGWQAEKRQTFDPRSIDLLCSLTKPLRLALRPVYEADHSNVTAGS